MTKRILGYPKNDSCLRNWINDFKKTGMFQKLKTLDIKIYSQEEIDFACEYYDECKDLKRTVEDLRYPSDISILHYRIQSRDKIVIQRQRAAPHMYSLKEKGDIFKRLWLL